MLSALNIVGIFDKEVAGNQAIIDAIKTKIPAKLDSKMWAEGYSINQGTDPNGNEVLTIEVRFYDEAHRTTALNWIKNKAGQVAGQLLDGSYVGYHSCDHDETVRTGCSPITKVWEK